MNPIKWLDKLPLDKSHHAIGGMIIWAISIALGANIWQGVFIVIVAAAAKELYDYFTPNHTADFLDWVATVSLPAFVSFSINIAVLMILH